MGGPSDGIALADPSAPINPEQAAQALGALLLERHDGPPNLIGRIDLASYAAATQRAADAIDDAVIESGPYLDRSRQELARIVVDTVAALPASNEPAVAITPRLGLAAVIFERSGSLTIVGETVAGDRHLDLARVAVGLAVRWGPAIVAPFLDAYGLDRVDLRRLDTCQLLTAVADEVGVAEPIDAP